ncbi:serine--tRNA ligase, cytoplasmic-like [Homalodisca vitripennis]|uniref:serine--tRNA ligase, cytoplasmic-like n=1 Tax=Homalodisca vitripennis TaxID=197043 RepID=UPI001EEC335A|nr:serine--tRNA ligase, cytoplasmic-like [Homalodisca vitripennis]
MVLDLELFRVDKKGNPEIIRENQRKRFKDVTLVDKVVENDINWRELRYICDKYNSIKKLCSKEIGIRIKNNEDSDEKLEVVKILSIDSFKPEVLKSSSITQIKNFKYFLDKSMNEYEDKMNILEKARNEALKEIGNILHLSVPISNNEDNNETIFTSGNVSIYKKYSHVDLVQMIEGVDTEVGPEVSGKRGYYLKGPCVLLQMALVQFALHKWFSKGYQPIYTPYFMRKEIMQEVAQLSQFDEELYRIVGKSVNGEQESLDQDEKYLIATSEQPLAALHRGQWLPETSLPIRYIGQSACFRQEVGSHGRDTGGIFRVHQFEKIEQFVLTSPFEEKSWEMMDEMLDNCKEFYDQLGIAYRVVNIVSGALNNSASKKLDLEAWFPGSGAFRELVSCSNCLDYQSRRLLVRYGQTKKMNEPQSFVHMLNATACATTRVICAVLETYQMDEGIEIPGVLKKYFPQDYPDVIPFKKVFPLLPKDNKQQ